MTPEWWFRETDEGDEGDDVLIVQRKLGARMTGVYDTDTASRVRGFQRKHRLEETGTVTKKTAAKVGDKASKGQAPDWYSRELGPGDTGTDVKDLRVALKQPLLPDYFDNSLEDAVRRFQSAAGLKPTGRVTKATAVALANRSA